MHLLRIEAVRYGELAGVALGDLGPGLNVVLGPNESGKSTFTSLVRHVLYGFPRGRASERLYQPPSGDQRVGRLVFAADGGAVTVERVEGVRGGTAVLSGPHGEEPADALLEELTRGVSAAVFAAVFGFSLEELSNLRSLDDIQARLVTSTSGLALDPHDAIAELRGRSEELWAPRARGRLLRDLAAELRELKEQRRQLEAAAERFRDDREERELVSAELENSEASLAAARGAADRMAALLGEARRLSEAARAEEEAAVEERLRAEALRRDAAAVEVDERLLSRAEALERLAARGELFHAEAEQLRRDEGRLRELELDLERRLGDLGAGWTLEAALGLRLDLDLETRLAAAEELLLAARRQQEESARRAAEAAAEHRAAHDEARARAAAAGAGGDDAAAGESVRLRLQAVDRLLALGTRGGAARAGRWPALAAAVVAVVLAVAGLGLGDRWLLIGAALPALLAAALALAGWWQGRRFPSELAPLLAILGCEAAPSPAELIALRSGLEEPAQLGRTAAARRQAAEEAAAAAGSAWSDWVGWLEAQRLTTASNEPESVRRVLRLLRDLRTRAEGVREIEAQAARRSELCEAFAAEAAAAGVTGGDGGPGRPAYDELRHNVRSLLSQLVAARKHEARRRELLAGAAAAEERAGALAARAAAARGELRETLAAAGLRADAPVAELEATATGLVRRARELEAERERLIERRGALDARLESAAAEARSGELRLAEAGVRARIARALESYAEIGVAVRLLEESLAVHEAARQPLVLRRAQELFARITDGRYQRLATPLGRFELSVAAAGGVGKVPSNLSRGTAEQLYLALRLSYIEHLASAHPALPVLMDDVLVNFDSGRQWTAAGLIADFAATRQVVFFTCHESTAKALRDAAEECTFLALDD
jgi:uncharacterized protein YhaN